MVALDMDGKVRKPQFELDSEQVRYEHRFAPFNSVVTPPPVHYIQFKVLFVCAVLIILGRLSLPFLLCSLFLHSIRFVLSHFTFLSFSMLFLTFNPLQEMSDLKKYNPPPGSADLYLAASKHFQQAKLILENVPSPDPEVILSVSCCMSFISIYTCAASHKHA